MNKKRRCVPGFGMRMRKKIILAAFIFAVLFSVIFSGVYLLRKSGEETGEKDLGEEELAEDRWQDIVVGQDGKEEGREEERDGKEEAAVRKYPVEISGLSDEALEILGASKEEIAEEILEWAQKNGCSSARSASFQNSMEIRFDDSKYTMNFSLDFEEEGNGDQPEGGMLFTMDFYKGERGFFFHR